MKQTAVYGLKKPEGTDVVNIDDLNYNADVIDKELKVLNDKKVDKVAGKQLSTEDYTTAEKQKLAGISSGANNYSHPTTHPGNIITEDSTHRWTTDSEKSNWNDANNRKHDHANKAILDGITQTIVNGWNSALSHIGDVIRHITADERNLWNTVSNKVDKVAGKQLSTEDYSAVEKQKLSGIAASANNYVHPNDTNTRHVTDIEKVNWNSKANGSHTHSISQITDFKDAIDNMSIYSTYKTGKDTNGIYADVQLKRRDGTLAIRSVLSGGTSPNYNTRTITEYALNGTTIVKTTIYALSYDADDNLISEVLK